MASSRSRSQSSKSTNNKKSDTNSNSKDKNNKKSSTSSSGGSSRSKSKKESESPPAKKHDSKSKSSDNSKRSSSRSSKPSEPSKSNDQSGLKSRRSGSSDQSGLKSRRSGSRHRRGRSPSPPKLSISEPNNRNNNKETKSNHNNKSQSSSKNKKGTTNKREEERSESRSPSPTAPALEDNTKVNETSLHNKHHHHHHKQQEPPHPQDLQSWCEVPSIAHFCSLFRQAFDLLEFDIQELEESFLLMGTEDDTSQLVLRLVIKLLKGCSRTFTNNINEDNYNTYLRRLFLSKREEAEEDNLEFNFECRALLDDDVDFSDLSLWHRVNIVHQLCEFRLEADDVMDKVKNLDATSLRVEPLGVDSEDVTYWYFYGTRLYREIQPPKDEEKLKRRKDKERKKKKKEKKKKKKKRNHRDSISSAEDEYYYEVPRSIWSVACLTLEDWENLTEKYKKSKKKTDRELYETLSDSFLPEIVKMFAEKEREEKRRLLMMQPKRASNRIERKKQEQEERDRILAIKLEEERRLEEEYDEKVRLEREKREEEERERSREERRKQREEMKELRAKRAAEKEVENKFSVDVDEQRQQQTEEMIEKEKHAKSLRRARFGSSDEEDDEEEDVYVPPAHSVKRSKRDDEDDEDDDSSTDSFDRLIGNVSAKEKKSKKQKQDAKSTFTNALLKVGTKSTKDSTLDKPLRKTPGLLLETAGRSLMQKSASTAAAKTSLSFGLAPPNLLSSSSPGASDTSSVRLTGLGGTSGVAGTKLSFGLYGGHLHVDHGNYTKSDGSDMDSDALGSSSFSNAAPVRKVFSNWGGEFFKKNLDYRANTNKILEKMNLGSPAAPANGGAENSSIPPPASSPMTSFVPGERFKALLQATSVSPGGGKRPLDANQPVTTRDSSSPVAKKLKTGNTNVAGATWSLH